MSFCNCENWSLKDLSAALQNKHTGNKRIVVPMFQRGKRWNKEQQNTFINSIKRGFPVGTMLFYEKIQDGNKTYILVDGLQRGTCIRKYINHPTEFLEIENIPDKICSSILDVLKVPIDRIDVVRTGLLSFIKSQNTFENVQFFDVATEIEESLSVEASNKQTKSVIDIINAFYADIQNTYNEIANSAIPVITYSGDEANLPEIFDRINSRGTPLNIYEVYAAAWPVEEKYYIESTDIVRKVILKYDAFISDGFIIDGYNRDSLLDSHKLNAFEFMFGLSKYLVNKYSILSFNTSLSDDANNALAFELVDACFNDNNEIGTLYKIFRRIDINSFERALEQSIRFVSDSVSVITKFKGNSRNSNKTLHSKFQIMSMIATAFRAMYPNEKYEVVSADWNVKKNVLKENFLKYYVFDIIDNTWSEGGTTKIYKVLREGRYYQEIAFTAWKGTLTRLFDRSMQRQEQKKVQSPTSEDIVILNTIYKKTFSAEDQLSMDKFDIEHIATKEQMKNLILSCNGEGLPISSIANLCYLPECVNRSKGAKNFYQDKNYLNLVSLPDVEAKYSFTQNSDLSWMDEDYRTVEDYIRLKKNYISFCNNRFETIKNRFFDSLGIHE